MRDTRLVYMGTFEQFMRQDTIKYEMIKQDVVAQQKHISMLYNKIAKAEKQVKAFTIVTCIGIVSAIIAIYLTIFL